ncbi:sensor histidine kinase [Myxococcus sp. RHSTA-1-4]|uniref:sensor histidine kinase n=1 Tax=Myxococcus sp. RHSTA-1-4 TaxID=2874601 RepID=UPI001CC1AAF6|nr:ATP-binding protein [Myxococcus sp. RHSTA-1-4]MBZ4416883.1 histidine kinase [Myxococcus sp. RHSTA-1-4]
MTQQQLPTPIAPEADAAWMNARLKHFTLAACILIHLLLIYALWGRWERIALVTAVFLAVTGINIVLAQRFFSQHTRTAESLRFVVNMLANVIYGLASDWALPMWLYLPLNALWVDRFADPRARLRLAVSLALVAVVALVDGCPPLVPACFVLVSLLVYFISEGRVLLTHQALQSLARQHEELERAHKQLDVAHHRAREQERLTSLGMLAAGVAHEINNPMSYVKSNVNSLFHDLRACDDLPPELREYVDDVLPATLDGIRRVTAIVADLRRFARGDPEAVVEYDLNQEVAVALRIARGQLGPQCEVTLDLKDLPRLLGHPGQIAQVVVNLLMNAAQAMPEGGRILLSTRMEGEEAVLEVRDTGVGMAPEVRARLFEPFFTTKSPGEGTGMGLAVVHGIVTAHSGRIQVDSAPGQGATFTIHLPRVPSLALGLPGAMDGGMPSLGPLTARTRTDAA